jgi:outer membrane protein OmpA-like peptidoglycan-associated protein
MARSVLAKRALFNIRIRSFLLLLALAGATPRPAGAQLAQRLSVEGELGAGSMLSSHQRSELDYKLGIQTSARVGVALVDALVLQGAVSHWGFPHSDGWGRATLLGGGLRFRPAMAPGKWFFVDGHAGLGLTGPYDRFVLDVGTGVLWSVAPWLDLGPAIRYGQLTTKSTDFPADARFVTAGLLLALKPPAAPPAAPPPPLPAPPPPPSPAPPDTDRDGIIDAKDACPEIPAGPTPDPERPGCPDGDDDADGYVNHADNCPKEPPGPHPDPARPGCPKSDRDRDTVPDDVDACPDEPGAPHDDPKLNGCPGLVRVDESQIAINKPVFFATDKATILKKSFPVLRAVAAALRATPAITSLSIEGHTDDRGSDAYNMDLSTRRAESVRKFLIAEGIEASRLTAVGFGKLRRVNDSRTAAARAGNRRVEFRIVESTGFPKAR